MKTTEAKLKSQVTMFGINQPDKIELMQLEKVKASIILLLKEKSIRKLVLQDVAAIELVWQITNEWYESWDNYRTHNFWDIKMEEMEDTANILFRKLNRLSRELKEKKWEILEHSR